MTKMSKKIYVVTDGDYSDYHIVAICSTKKIAERTKKMSNAENIEEHAFDTIQRVPLNHNLFKVIMKKDGSSEVEQLNESYYFREAAQNFYGLYGDEKQSLIMSVFAKHKEHAVKIVNEKRIQLIERREWKK